MVWRTHRGGLVRGLCTKRSDRPWGDLAVVCSDAVQSTEGEGDLVSKCTLNPDNTPMGQGV